MSQLTIKAPSHQYDDQVRSGVDELMNHYFNTRIASELKVSNVETGIAEIRFHKTWKLDTRTHHETRTGQLSGQNYHSLSDCQQAVSRTCDLIESGFDTTFTSALESFVAGSPTQATWQQTCDLGRHGTVFQHVHSCNTCGGRGSNTCSSCSGQGRCQCNYCYGQGRTSCGTCGGNGQTGSGQYRTYCGSCGGSGRANCHSCFGSGQSQCGNCGGRGEHACSPCDATGYFTERYTINVHGISTLQVTLPADLGQWQRSYMAAAINGDVEWASLSAACFLDATSILRNADAYPIRFEIQGTLPFTEARLGLRGTTSEAYFVGEKCHVFQLGNLGDAVFVPLAESLTDPEDQDSLQTVLGTRAAEQILSARSEPVRAETSVLRRAGIVGQDAVTTLLKRYHAIRTHMNVSRSSHTLMSWVRKSIKYSVVFLLLIGLLDALYGNYPAWEKTGLNRLSLWITDLPGFLLSLSYDLVLEAPLAVKGTWLAACVVAYLVALPLLLSRRKMTKKRFFLGLLVSHLILAVLLFCFNDFINVVNQTAPQLPGLHQLAAGLIRSLLLLPEAIVVGLLLGMLRLRLRNDAQLKKFVTAVGSKPLLEDLGYRA